MHRVPDYNEVILALKGSRERVFPGDVCNKVLIDLIYGGSSRENSS